MDGISIFDLVIIGLLVLAAITGYLKGGAKIFFGFIMLLIIFVAAAFLSTLVTPALLKTETETQVTYSGLAKTIMDPVGNALPADGEIGTVLNTVIVEKDGVLYLGDQTLTAAITSVIPSGDFVASMVVPAAHDGDTLRTVISYVIAEFAYRAILWIVFVIILLIIRRILRKKVFKFLDGHRASNKIDRLIGLVVNVATFLVILWGFGAIVGRYAGSAWADMINDYLNSGVVAGPLMGANPFLSLLGVK